MGGNQRRTAVNLRRSGTLQAQIERPHAATASPPSPTENEEDYQEGSYADEEYQYNLQQQQRQSNAYNQTSGQYTPGRSSPWSMSNEWKYTQGLAGNNNGNSIDDVQRALSSLEISNGGYTQNQGFSNGGGIGARVSQSGSAISPPSGVRSSVSGNGLVLSQNSGKLNLNLDDGNGQIGTGGGFPPIGHGLGQQQQSVLTQSSHSRRASNASAPGSERGLVSRTSNSNLQYSAANYDASGLPPNPPLPTQYLNQQGGTSQGPRHVVSGFSQGQIQAPVANGGQQVAPGFLSAPLDVPTLTAAKGYNPTQFDCKPLYVSLVLVMFE